MSSLLLGALRLSASGSLPADEAWQRYTRPARWTEWAPHLREIDYSEPVIRPGTSGRVTGVGGVVAEFQIDAVDEKARTWSWSVRSGPLGVSFDRGVNVAPSGLDQLSTAWLVARGLWPVVLGYAPIARYSLGRLVNPR